MNTTHSQAVQILFGVDLAQFFGIRLQRPDRFFVTLKQTALYRCTEVNEASLH